MKILVDLHHDDLFWSLVLLFEKRLGFELYRPIGLEWYTENFWSVYQHPATASQFLGIDDGPPRDPDGNECKHGIGAWLNKNTQKIADGVYEVTGVKNRKSKAIRLEQAKDMKFDIVLSSMPDHFPLYERFRQLFCPKARHIWQAGNMWKVPDGVKNFLNSTSVDPRPGINHVRYHQEFDLTDYCCVPCDNPKSMINLMHLQAGHFPDLFGELKAEMIKRGWDVKNYGAGNDDGPVDDTAAALKQTGVLWHVKRGGGGSEYNPHHSFACGRPVVIKSGQIQGQIAGRLFQDGLTVVDLDARAIHDAAIMLEDVALNHEVWRERVKRRFDMVVNFDKEEQAIRQFIAKLR